MSVTENNRKPLPQPLPKREGKFPPFGGIKGGWACKGEKVG